MTKQEYFKKAEKIICVDGNCGLHEPELEALYNLHIEGVREIELKTLLGLQKHYIEVQQDLDVIYEGNVQPNFMGILEGRIEGLEEQREKLKK